MARLPKSIIKKYGITKKAWSIFKGRKRRSPSRRSSNPKKRSVVKTVRRRRYGRKRGGGGRSLTRTAFKFIRLGALIGGGVQSYQDGGGGVNGVKDALIGYGGMASDGKFYPHILARQWTPYLMACAVTYGIPKLISIIRRL